MCKQIIFHIGFPKTGTTTLQNQLFSAYGDQIGYIGYPDASTNQTKRDVLQSLTHLDRMEFGLHEEKYKSAFDALVSSLSSARVVVSDEAFSVGRKYPGFNDRSDMAERIKAVCPNAKILLVVRNQADMLKSFYLQHVRQRDVAIEFKSWVDKEISLAPKFSATFSLLKYSHTFELYAQLFGAENVCVLFFEDLVANPKHFAADLHEFLNLSQNSLKDVVESISVVENPQLTQGGYLLSKLKSNPFVFSAASSKILKPFSKVAMRLINYLFSRKKQVQYTDSQLDFIHRFYKASNQRLREQVGRELSDKYVL